MDCRTCQPTLLDLAYGELAPELATVVRAHVDGCDNCGAALKALQQGMEGAEQLAWLEPPPAMSANILAYAEQHAREGAQAALAARAAAKPRVGFVQSIFDFIGRLASGRQFAMATVFVLVVTVGFWALPELQPLPEGHGVTVVSPDPAGEAAPSGGLAPAEPLDLAVDARSRRIRSRDELAEAAQLAKNNALAASELAAEEQAPSVEPTLTDDRLVAQSAHIERRGDLEGEAYPAAKSQPVATKGELGESKRSKAAGPEAFPESDMGELASASTGMRERSVARAPAPASTTSASPPPASAPVPAQQRPAADVLLDMEGLGDGALANAPAKPKAKSSSGSSLERARTARATEGCAAALPAYEQAVQEYSRSSPQSAVLGTALMELAECQWQLGRESSARATLKRASQVAPVAVRARAMLEGNAASSAPAAPAEAVPAGDSRK
jgi:hypothetical protein